MDLDALSPYLLAHSTPADEVLADLARETRETFPSSAGMQISADEGRFLTLVTQLVGARTAVEVGVFTGYSSVCIARGLADGGRLLAFDVSEEFTALARRAWDRAGVADRVTLTIGPAADGLRALPAGETVDLAFVDADKTGYGTYYDELVPRLRPGGVLLLDNVLQGGRVIDEAAQDDSVVAIRALNDRIVADERVTSVMLPLRDGVTLVRKNY